MTARFSLLKMPKLSRRISVATMRWGWLSQFRPAMYTASSS